MELALGLVDAVIDGLSGVDIEGGELEGDEDDAEVSEDQC